MKILDFDWDKNLRNGLNTWIMVYNKSKEWLKHVGWILTWDVFKYLKLNIKIVKLIDEY